MVSDLEVHSRPSLRYWRVLSDGSPGINHSWSVEAESEGKARAVGMSSGGTALLIDDGVKKHDVLSVKHETEFPSFPLRSLE